MNWMLLDITGSFVTNKINLTFALCLAFPSIDYYIVINFKEVMGE